jgi:predicted dienelactone hydrolase
MRFFTLGFILMLHFLCESGFSSPLTFQIESEETMVKMDTVRFFDSIRNRQIPVAIYTTEKLRKKPGIAIISHGYWQNRGVPYLDYDFIANALAAQGYLVASIQHELPGDPLIPTTGPLYESRLPFWERGVANILFVIDKLKAEFPQADLTKVTLIGHSNGGDMSMLFAAQYPAKVANVISLDNRRVTIPRTSKPAILTLRSSDQPADKDVLPTAAEQKQFGIRVVKLSDTIHNDMDDRGTSRQKDEMLKHMLNFLHLKH